MRNSLVVAIFLLVGSTGLTTTKQPLTILVYDEGNQPHGKINPEKVPRLNNLGILHLLETTDIVDHSKNGYKDHLLNAIGHELGAPGLLLSRIIDVKLRRETETTYPAQFKLVLDEFVADRKRAIAAEKNPAMQNLIEKIVNEIEALKVRAQTDTKMSFELLVDNQLVERISFLDIQKMGLSLHLQNNRFSVHNLTVELYLKNEDVQKLMNARYLIDP
jgi:glutaredoxin 2